MNEYSKRSSTDSPLVSVVMPALNAERFVAEAVRSIIGQTLTDWELVFVDDGCTDRTADIVRSFGDDRIRVIRHEANQGLSVSYNDGIRASRGTFIARMDADDVMEPERLARQAAFLRHHPRIDILGTEARTMDEQGVPGGILWRPRHPAAVRYLALWETPLLHPTVMARSQLLKDNPYDESFFRSEDYELWSRLLFDEGILAANLGEPLVRHRLHPRGFTRSAGRRGSELVVSITMRNIERYLPLHDADRALVARYRQGAPMSARQIAAWALLIAKVGKAFRSQERPPLAAAPAMMRIGTGLLWRMMKRSWRNRA